MAAGLEPPSHSPSPLHTPPTPLAGGARRARRALPAGAGSRGPVLAGRGAVPPRPEGERGRLPCPLLAGRLALAVGNLLLPPCPLSVSPHALLSSSLPPSPAEQRPGLGALGLHLCTGAPAGGAGPRADGGRAPPEGGHIRHGPLLAAAPPLGCACSLHAAAAFSCSCWVMQAAAVSSATPLNVACLHPPLPAPQSTACCWTPCGAGPRTPTARSSCRRRCSSECGLLLLCHGALSCGSRQQACTAALAHLFPPLALLPSCRRMGGTSGSWPVLQQVAAHLYTVQGRHEEALRLQLQLRSPVVFDYVARHALEDRLPPYAAGELAAALRCARYTCFAGLAPHHAAALASPSLRLTLHPTPAAAALNSADRPGREPGHRSSSRACGRRSARSGRGGAADRGGGSGAGEGGRGGAAPLAQAAAPLPGSAVPKRLAAGRRVCGAAGGACC